MIEKNCSLYRTHKVLYMECQSWHWPLTPWPTIHRVSPLTIHNFHVKFGSDWANTGICIVFIRFNTQSAKVDLDRWPFDPKSIGALLSKSTTCMWSLKVIWQNLESVSCPQSFIHRVRKLTLTLDPVNQNQQVPPLIIHNLHAKFERDWAKTVVCIVPPRFYAYVLLYKA